MVFVILLNKTQSNSWINWHDLKILIGEIANNGENISIWGRIRTQRKHNNNGFKTGEDAYLQKYNNWIIKARKK